MATTDHAHHLAFPKLTDSEVECPAGLARAQPYGSGTACRLPRGETVIVNLVKTSAELSADSHYPRTARADNLLRWDIGAWAGSSRGGPSSSE